MFLMSSSLHTLNTFSPKMVSVIFGCSYHAGSSVNFLISLVIIDLMIDSCMCAVYGWDLDNVAPNPDHPGHQRKMAAPLFVFRLHFCTVGVIGDVSSIFILSMVDTG